MFKKIAWPLFAFAALSIGLYPLMYFAIDRKFGLLSTKSAELLANIPWNVAFYVHILLGGLALLIGWVQFSPKFRQTKMNLHRLLGKLYVLAALLSALAGIYIGFFATGGLVSVIGFVSLGIIWFITTLLAYTQIKNKQIDRHEKTMVYSYAACFAAVSLRIWLPILIAVFGDFMTAYKIVAWLCWVPNLLFAYWFLRQKQGIVAR
jgi:uncharacterized membrane protein